MSTNEQDLPQDMPQEEPKARRMTLLEKCAGAVGLIMWLAAGVLWKIDSASPPRAIAQAIPVPAASTNAYWAGYVATQRAPYTAVQASWTVPPISCSHQSGSNATTYVWIGEGGYLQGLASPLLQAGTGSDCLGGMPRYHAFYEWYPGIYATDFPLILQPGDTVTVQIQQTAPDYWVLSFHDETTNTRSATAVLYRVDTGSADFIVERPTLCVDWTCQQFALGKFPPIVFDNVRARTAADPDLQPIRNALPIALADPITDRLLALPARLSPSHDSLSVVWRRGS